MCEEIYNQPLDNKISANNSHAFNKYINTGEFTPFILNTINVNNITNRNCLNSLGLMCVNNYHSIVYNRKMYNMGEILLNIGGQFCKINNASKPHIIKKLFNNMIVSYPSYNGVCVYDYLMKICMENNSYDVAKYLMLHFNENKMDLPKLIEHYNNDINLLIKHYQFLLDNNCINILKFCRCVYKQDFKYKDVFIEIFSKYIDKNTFDILKL
jgi:hypothetical protein